VNDLPSPALPASRGAPIVALAPLAEVTDGAFRAVAAAAGADAATTEMVSAAGLVRGSRGTPPLLERMPAEGALRVSAQLYGHDPAELAEAARAVAGLGRFAAIDLNAGCPMRRIAGNGDGAALMDDPALLGRCVAAMARAAAPLPVTVKTRIGAGPDRPAAALLARVCEENGAALVAVHGRYASRMHAGPVDAARIAEAVAAVRIPVLANGGVRSASDALALLRATGAAGVMVGRGALGAPWIFARIKAALAGREPPPAPGPAERAALARRHLALAIEWHRLLRERFPDAGGPGPETAAVLDFRRHLFHYFDGLPGVSALRRGMAFARTPADLDAAIGALYDATSASSAAR
jgi:nifR3 family TIM-barrel protein